MKAKTNKAKKTNLQPAPGYLMISPDETETKTESGIYLPDTASEEKPQKGTVVAVGDTEINEHGIKRTSYVKKGQKVLYKKWGGTEVKINGEGFLFVKFDDILAIEN